MSDRIVPELTEEVLSSVKAEMSEDDRKRLHVMTAVVGETEEENQHVLVCRPQPIHIKRYKQYVNGGQRDQAHANLVADCLKWPPKEIKKKLFEEYPSLEVKIAEELTRLARGDAPELAKKV